MNNEFIINFLNEMTPIKYFECLIGSILLFILPLNKKSNKIFALIIVIYVVNELISNYFIAKNNQQYFDYNNILYDVSIASSFTLWLLLLFQLNISKNLIPLLITLFALFIGIILLLFGTGIGPNLIFPFGSFIYITLYFKDCFEKLKKENFDYFFKNDFVLMSSPILMFFGISMMFSFVSGELQFTKIFGFNLIIIVGSYTNFITYTLFIIYAYREYKQHKLKRLNHDF